MKVRFRKMNGQEFDEYREYSTNDYVNDLMKGKKLSFEEALKQSKKEFLHMLPEGTDTKDNFVMMIEDADIGKIVGIIWYLHEVFEGVKQVFLCDFLIYEEERIKGYATAALVEMEKNALVDGCAQSALFVWKHNPPGINLYTKCGYVTIREGDAGMFMRKEIR